MPCEDILRVFTGGTGGSTTAKRFAELTRIQRQRFVEEASWLQLDPAAVTADTPVPFDINIVWHTLDYENNETRHKKSDPATVAVRDEGDAAALRSAHFEPYNPGSTTPDKAPTYGNYGSTPEVLRLGLLDNRLQFFLQPVPDPNGDVDPLVAAMTDWLGGEKPISILDFSGVPDQAAELAIGVVLNLLFEMAVRSEPDGPGIGRPNPVLVVLEEAHRYLGDKAAPIAGVAANRIAREGRKYGVGLMLVTQRPSELPDTALAQCGTLIALRLSNSQDQGKIRAALPDSVAGLAAALPASAIEPCTTGFTHGQAPTAAMRRILRDQPVLDRQLEDRSERQQCLVDRIGGQGSFAELGLAVAVDVHNRDLVEAGRSEKAQQVPQAPSQAGIACGRQAGAAPSSLDLLAREPVLREVGQLWWTGPGACRRCFRGGSQIPRRTLNINRAISRTASSRDSASSVRYRRCPS